MKEKKTESTVSDLYIDLDNNYDDVEGIIDDVIVVIDPDVTSDEYDEIIARNKEIIESTPEGEIPYDESFEGQYLLTCPICGSTFISKVLLQPGATCPVCLDIPENFVVVGVIGNEQDSILENGIEETEDILTPEADEMKIEFETEPEEEEEEEEEEVVEEPLFASETIRTSTKKLEEENEEELIDIDIDTLNQTEEQEETETEKETNNKAMLNTEQNEVDVTKNSFGFYIRGLIVDDNNKQYQFVDGQLLPLGKYNVVSTETIAERINELRDDGYKEYKGEGSVEINI